ncbi:MAG: type IV toxin-antitoxin system AbiEi family antitoxin domain-containing protein [Candidatus Gribaldobacteria bacterium]|nr:type IV toxin-antitoxin system AbiEi family antitoxin domain-containing protein [Candidatus Gribaldobacteria bacterium]
MSKQALKQNKLNLLLKSPENLFHTQDLFLLWGGGQKNTLYTTIKRYVQRGVLIRIKKGFYAKWNLSQLNPVALGMGFLHSFSYLSTETILAQNGVISQPILHITLISDKSKKFKIKEASFICRQLSDQFLFNKTGIIEKDGINCATMERAVADMLYFSSNYHFDAPNLINWEKVKEMQKQIGYA